MLDLQSRVETSFNSVMNREWFTISDQCHPRHFWKYLSHWAHYWWCEALKHLTMTLRNCEFLHHTNEEAMLLTLIMRWMVWLEEIPPSVITVIQTDALLLFVSILMESFWSDFKIIIIIIMSHLKFVSPKWFWYKFQVNVPGWWAANTGLGPLG